MQAVRKKSSPWKKIIGTLLEMAGVIVVASGFLKLSNLLLECALIIAGFIIFVLGAKCRTG